MNKKQTEKQPKSKQAEENMSKDRLPNGMAPEIKVILNPKPNLHLNIAKKD